MDRLDCDRMFVAVMETGSFTAAAERLATSSGQASKLVSRLETELGVRLLNRTTRSISPTEAGKAYFDRLRLLLEEYDHLDVSVRDVSQTPRGRLRLTAPLSFGVIELTPALNDFALRYPEIELDVSFSDRVTNLVDEGFDMAIRIGRPADSSLVARKLCDVRIVVVGASSYIDRMGEPGSPDELIKHTCVIDTNFREPDRWPFRSPTGDVVMAQVAGRMRYSNAEACLRAAEAGLGLAFVPSFVAGASVREGGVRRLLQEFETTPFLVHALYPHSRHLAAKVRVLVDFLAERYRGIPHWERDWIPFLP
ncbi:LysR family transcriptional regulator [Pelagibacterium lentulum]|uniref:Transcriptional regulator n=1 Tax=Pelagibacterium lentulum TaxID=2029865 RepID=A0A916RGL7_9HYPH|nr:LysR family transcriptional regulator [Pelagibacterium lentulum]GGA53633.1 transcriptional regulator [Pelagibacterium lentulum]